MLWYVYDNSFLLLNSLWKLRENGTIILPSNFLQKCQHFNKKKLTISYKKIVIQNFPLIAENPRESRRGVVCWPTNVAICCCLPVSLSSWLNLRLFNRNRVIMVGFGSVAVVKFWKSPKYHPTFSIFLLAVLAVPRTSSASSSLPHSGMFTSEFILCGHLNLTRDTVGECRFFLDDTQYPLEGIVEVGIILFLRDKFQ